MIAKAPASRPISVKFVNDELVVTLHDGRTISTPLEWYPRLKDASGSARENYRIMSTGIHWPDLDEDLSIEGMLKGKLSRSLQRGAQQKRAKTRDFKRTAEAEASVGVSAKAIYERKKNITEIVPPDVLRAKAGAWLDLLSPLTEWAGLKGDEIRRRRDLLRIQQEETIQEITRRAVFHLLEAKATVRPVQLKFLLPFLEKASWEEPESDLVGWWSNLLASAAEVDKSTHPKFVDVLSTMTVGDARFLDELWSRLPSDLISMTEAEVNSFVVDQFVDRAQGFVSVEADRFDEKMSTLVSEFTKECEQKGLLIESIHYPTSKNIFDRREARYETMSVGVLISSYLLRKTELVFALPTPFIGEYNCFLQLISISDFGRRFMKACRLENAS